MFYDEAPNYLKAADFHNIADENTSLFDDVANALGNAPAFGQVAAASALNSFYNSAVAFTNLSRAEDMEFEQRDTAEWIASYDDNLAQYYEDNKAAADIVGFVAGSFIPGTAGVKGLNAAQKALRAAEAGMVGSNMRLATNLLAPSMQHYVKKEAADLAGKSAAYSMFHQNSLKALASGTHQAVLESLAFELAVTATLFKSPILEDMDAWDITKNIAMGGVFGGAIGALGSSASTYFGVKGLLRNADARQKAVTSSTQLGASGAETRFADRIVAGLDDEARLAREITPDEVRARKVAQGETGYSISDEAIRTEVHQLNRLRNDNLQKLRNDRRVQVRTMANGDDQVGNLVADLGDRLPMQGRFSVFHNMTEVARAGAKTKLDKLKSATRAMLPGMKRKEVDELLEAQEEATSLYIRVHSGKVGDVMAGKAGHARLADKYSAKEIDELVTKANARAMDATDFRKVKNLDDMQLRYIAARSGKGVVFNDKTVLGAWDIPFLEEAVRAKVPELKVRTDSGVLEIKGAKNVEDFVANAKEEVALAQMTAKRGAEVAEIASNIRRDYLEAGSKAAQLDKTAAFDAIGSYAAEASKFYGRQIDPTELLKTPRTVKATYSTKEMVDEAGMVMEGMQMIKYRQKLAKETADRVFAKFAGEMATLFPEIPESLLLKANRTGTGAGVLTNAGAEYGTLEEMTSYVGNLVSELTKKRIAALTDDINPVALALRNNPEAAVSFSTINEILSGTTERYVLNEAGDALIPRKLQEYYRKLADDAENLEPPKLQEGAPESIPLDSAELVAAVKMHIQRNGKRNEEWKELYAAQGLEDSKHADVFYPFRPSPNDYKFVAFVKDETLTGAGHTKMLFANTAKDLEDQIAKVPSQYSVFTKGQSEEFYTARGEWEYDKTLHDNYIDADMQTRGVSGRFFPMTDPAKIVNTWLADHIAKENTIIKQAVGLKYEKEITELRRLGELYTGTQRSYVGSLGVVDKLEQASKNPYLAQVKAMLNVTKLEDIKPWVTANQALDRVVSKAYEGVQAILGRGTSHISDTQVDEINGVMDKLGFRSAYYDAATHIMANSSVPKGVLAKFVRESNAFLTSTVLRLDFFNSINNLLGNTVLFSAEMKSLLKAVNKGDADRAGELAKLMKINLPGVEGQLIKSPAKLISNSMKRLYGEGDASKQLIEEYKKRGMAPDLTDQFFKALDSMSLTGSETVRDLSTKSARLKEAWSKFVEKGEKVTLNKYAEQFNRLIAADVMKQVTEIAVKQGILDERAAWAYVNTFTNRVNGVIRAAERPLMFQGPIGQAMGLFQSYQFNLMQQMFRYVGDGNRKIAAMAMGLQGAIYGAASLPGFSAINNYLIAGASGNEGRTDLYNIANTILGKAGSEWLMYGAPSNILRASLFTRGDTNPRTWSIVPNPTNPSELPFVAAYSKAFSSMHGALKNASNGAPVWDSFVSGIEHSGFSRPLAGMAAVSRSLTNPDGKVTATDRSGSIVGSNDLVTWASLVRVAGAKPIDEAIINNAYYRINANAVKDREKRKEIATQVKLSVLGGNQLTSEQVEAFAERYVQYGGKQTGFNQFMMEQYKNTDATRAEQMARALNSSYARNLQQLMGGRDSLSELD